MYIRNITIILFSLLSSNVFGQSNLVVGINAGLATFSMKDLKNYHDQISAGLGVPVKVVESFPSYLNYSADITIGDKPFYRLSVGHTSTGGRLAYSDYSGSASMNMKVGMTYSGATIGFKVLESKSLKGFIGAQALYYFNAVEIIYEEVLYDVDGADDKRTTSYKSVNVAVCPMFELQHVFGRFLGKADISYELHFAGPLQPKESDFGIGNIGDVKVNADGLRIGVGIGYIF